MYLVDVVIDLVVSFSLDVIFIIAHSLLMFFCCVELLILVEFSLLKGLCIFFDNLKKS